MGPEVRPQQCGPDRDGLVRTHPWQQNDYLALDPDSGKRHLSAWPGSQGHPWQRRIGLSLWSQQTISKGKKWFLRWKSGRVFNWMLDNQSTSTVIAPWPPSKAGWFPIPKQLQQAPKDTSVKSMYSKSLLEAALNLWEKPKWVFPISFEAFEYP